MARTTLYCVDSYQPGARGTLVPRDHRKVKTADVARFTDIAPVAQISEPVS